MVLSMYGIYGYGITMYLRKTVVSLGVAIGLFTPAIAQTSEGNPSTWYWKITPIQYHTLNENGEIVIWHSRRSSEYFTSKKFCQQAIALRLKDHPISSNQVIGCYNMGPPIPIDVMSGSTIEIRDTIQTWVWTIEPKTSWDDATEPIESTHTFPSEGLCLSDAESFIEDEALDSEAQITCDMILEKPLGKWSYTLTPLNGVTQGNDGVMRSWSPRLGQLEFESLNDCQAAAQQAIKDMATSWNYEAQCHRSRQNIIPFQIMAPDSRVSVDDADLEVE